MPADKAAISADDTPIGQEMEIKQAATRFKPSEQRKTASTNFDEVDDIYFEKDPIGVSLKQRKKSGGLLTSVIKNANSKNGKYFFTLKVKRRLS